MIATVYNRTANTPARAITIALDTVWPPEHYGSLARIDPGATLHELDDCLDRGGDQVDIGTPDDPHAITVTRIGNVIAATNPALEVTCLVTIGENR